VAEHNLIQNPDVIDRAARFLGIRQRSTTPTLNESVQLVLTIGDVSKFSQGYRNRQFNRTTPASASCVATPAAASDSWLQVRNVTLPNIGGGIFRLRKFECKHNEAAALLCRMGPLDTLAAGSNVVGVSRYINRFDNPAINSDPGTSPGLDIRGGVVATSTNILTQGRWFDFYLRADTPFTLDDSSGISLIPNTGFALQTIGAANVSLNMSMVFDCDEYSV
jgi:hypothetical protein